MFFQISRTVGAAYLLNMGIASVVYFIGTGLLLGASGRSIQLKSLVPMLTGLIVALLLATAGWIIAGLLVIVAGHLLPKTLDPSGWLLWMIALLPSVCSGLIASGIPYSHFRPGKRRAHETVR